MLEDAFSGAVQNLNSTVLGSVLVITLVAFAFYVRLSRLDLKEARNELKDEREAHQKTREAQLQDIRNLNHVASTLESLQTAMVRMEDRVVDASIRRGRQ
jgi:hypothetical protein